MKLAYQITAFVGLIFAVAVAVAVAARDLRLMTRLGPGPGFFPFWLSVLFGCLSLALLVFAGRIAAYAAGSEEGPASNRVYLVVGAMIAAIALVGVFIEALGYCLTMFLFCMVTLLLLGERRWYVILVVAFLGSFGVYFVFARYLGVVLPAGVLSV